jgi:signal transduction histidine kinase
VKDQGKGHGRRTRNGVGISGMHERVEQLGGCLQIDSDEEGTAVKATIPMEVDFHG